MNFAQMGEVFSFLLAYREVSAEPIMGRKDTEASRIGRILDEAYALNALEGFEAFLGAQGFDLVVYEPAYFAKNGTAYTYVLARRDSGEAAYMNKDWVIDNMVDKRHGDTRDVRVIWAVQHWLALQQLLYTRYNRAVTEVSRFMEAMVTAQEFVNYLQELIDSLKIAGKPQEESSEAYAVLCKEPKTGVERRAKRFLELMVQAGMLTEETQREKNKGSKEDKATDRSKVFRQTLLAAVELVRAVDRGYYFLQPEGSGSERRLTINEVVKGMVL